MLYPYEFTDPLPTLELGDILISGYGCLTVAESIAFDRFISNEAIELLEMATPHTEAIATTYLQTVLATILLVSRHQPTWTLARVQQQLTPDQIQQASDFLLGERRRWKEADEPPPEPPSEAKTTAKLDWSKLRLRLAAAYPGEASFTRDGFGNCPLIVVEQSLEALNERELQACNAAALPIALLGTYLLQAEGVEKAEPSWINPFEQVLLERAAKSEVDPIAAKLFLQLCAEAKVPPWAVAAVDVEKLRLAAG